MGFISRGPHENHAVATWNLEVHLNSVWNYSSYLAENTLIVLLKDIPVNSVSRNNRSLMWDSYETQIHNVGKTESCWVAEQEYVQ
jgi:hypothetical protein